MEAATTRLGNLIVKDRQIDRRGVRRKSWAKNTMLLQVWHVSYPEQAQFKREFEVLERKLAATSYSPEPSLFYSLFPFHMLLDEDLNLVQIGSGLNSTIPSFVPHERSVKESFKVPGGLINSHIRPSSFPSLIDLALTFSSEPERRSPTLITL